MQLRDQPQALAQSLLSLQTVVSTAGRPGLQACVDYVLLPLVHLMDSIAHLSKGGDDDSQELVPFPAASSQKVAEAAVACASALLERCMPEGEAVINLLPRFAAVAQLDRNSASEEVRLAALQCLEAMLRSSTLKSQESASAAAEGEVAAGRAGSGAIRVVAIRALGCLIACVGPGDSWAFPLPGIVGRLGKALNAAAPSPGAQAPAADHATAGLDAMHALRQLDAKARGNAVGNGHDADLSVDAAGDSGTHAPPTANGSGPTAASMYVRRDVAWLSHAAPRLEKLLGSVMPPLCLHPAHSVRAALSSALDKLVDRIGPQLFQHLVEIRNIGGDCCQAEDRGLPDPWAPLHAVLNLAETDHIRAKIQEAYGAIHTAGRVDTNTSNNNSTGRLTLSTNLTEKPHALLALLVLADAGRGGVPLKGLARHVLTMAGGRYTWANKLYSLTDDIKRNRHSVGGLAVIMRDTMRQNTVLFTTSKRGYYFLRDYSRAIFDRIEDPEDAATVSKASLKYDQELAGGIPVTAVTTLQPRVLHILRAATAAAEPELRNLCISPAAAVCGTTPAVSPNTAGAASRIGPHKMLHTHALLHSSYIFNVISVWCCGRLHLPPLTDPTAGSQHQSLQTSGWIVG
ncbi:hypothetical protein WJX73_010492 [Symbiochloris irregularis]|uniref:TTI1 N-terminal TPR domain-containing protein n=1 Tax=Symbiochloris irregularis TaxID=706552 RepID=A0AAW1NSS8_9CHLO